jgi:putative transposase
MCAQFLSPASDVYFDLPSFVVNSYMQFEKGSTYHIYNRSINKELLYKSEENYLYFMQKFNYYLTGKIDVLAYCLMPTHFHFFIRAGEDSAAIEKSFKNLFISYAKAINRMYVRSGSLFQAKYKKEPIADEGHFTNVIAYIHLNPLKAGLCSKPGDWKFSSYKVITGNADTAVKRDEVLEWFGGLEKFIEYHRGYYGS